LLTAQRQPAVISLGWIMAPQARPPRLRSGPRAGRAHPRKPTCGYAATCTPKVIG